MNPNVQKKKKMFPYAYEHSFVPKTRHCDVRYVNFLRTCTRSPVSVPHDHGSASSGVKVSNEVKKKKGKRKKNMKNAMQYSQETAKRRKARPNRSKEKKHGALFVNYDGRRFSISRF